MSRAVADDDEAGGIDPDDLPSTHLDDDDYDAFLAREFDADGAVRGDPPVVRIILTITLMLAALALWLLL